MSPKELFAEKLHKAAMVMPSQLRFSAEVTATYLHHLSDLDVELCAYAVDELIETQRFFPSVSEIRAMVAGSQKSQADVESDGLWKQLIDLAGGTDPEKVDPFVADFAKSVGGQSRLGDLGRGQIETLYRESFNRRYADHRRIERLIARRNRARA